MERTLKQFENAKSIFKDFKDLDQPMKQYVLNALNAQYKQTTQKKHKKKTTKTTKWAAYGKRVNVSKESPAKNKQTELYYRVRNQLKKDYVANVDQIAEKLSISKSGAYFNLRKLAKFDKNVTTAKSGRYLNFIYRENKDSSE